jgi:hypothetical protein
MSDIVEVYLNDILVKQLRRFHISNRAIDDIICDIRIRLNSFIANYNDVNFRNALLILGSEEAPFYVPRNEQVAEMVVVCIRNSLLEGVSSSDYLKYNSSVYLQDKSIKIITSEAINYFSSKDLSVEASKIVLSDDYFKTIFSKYPVAYRALLELSLCTEQDREHSYKPFEIEKPFELFELDRMINSERKSVNIESGIDPKFNDSLCLFLNDIRNGNSRVLVFDSFKMVTRNIEKLLKIIEFTLTHGAFFVTCNYLIERSYVSRRKVLIKASHCSDEFFEKIPRLPEISDKYSDMLSEYVQL